MRGPVRFHQPDFRTTMSSPEQLVEAQAPIEVRSDAGELRPTALAIPFRGTIERAALAALEGLGDPSGPTLPRPRLGDRCLTTPAAGARTGVASPARGRGRGSRWRRRLLFPLG